MGERPADWPPGVRDVPEVRDHLGALLEAVGRKDIEAAVAAFRHLLALADQREEGAAKEAATRALTRLAARYPPDAVLGARLARSRFTSDAVPPMEAEERFSVTMALLITVFMKDSTPRSRA